MMIIFTLIGIAVAAIFGPPVLFLAVSALYYRWTDFMEQSE